MEKPENIKEITFDYIFEYIKGKGKEDKAWLKELASSTIIVKDKNGKIIKEEGEDKERDITFLEIRNEFAKKYIPEIMPEAKPKKPTMKERIASL